MDKHYMGTDKVMRFPRYADSEMEELERLEQTALMLIGQREEVRRELGYVFLRIKKMVGHGQWKLYFRRKFAHLITLHTATNYMKLARGEQYVMPKAKRETVSLFPPATDAEAVQRRKDAVKSQAEVEEKEQRTFRPSFLMQSVEEREQMEEMWRLHRQEVEKQGIELLRQLRKKLGSYREEAA